MLPTLLAMAKVQRSGKPALDGIDLSDVIAGKVSKRPPMGFWHGFQGGQGTWSDRILKAIMEAQQAGKPTPHPERLKKDIGAFPQFSETKLRGHAALLDWPWKLHSIHAKKLNYQLYNLSSDPMESKNLAANPEHRERLDGMQKKLNDWQVSVIRSLNGKDYEK
jgi:hypothetical protein